jgi:outer membrane protein OmpA-like peptidoglycan-associated protein
MSPAVLRTVFASCLTLGLVDLAWLDANAARWTNDGKWELLTRPQPSVSAELPRVIVREEPRAAATTEAVPAAPAATAGSRPIEPEPEQVTSCTIQFERSLSVLPPDQAANLVVIAEAMKTDPRATARIFGHADRMGWKGNRGDNFTLSENRALAVARALGKLGIPADRIKRAAFGDTHPIDERSTEDAYRRNRRVEVRIDPPGGR